MSMSGVVSPFAEPDLEAPAVTRDAGLLARDPRAPRRHAAGAIADRSGQASTTTASHSPRFVSKIRFVVPPLPVVDARGAVGDVGSVGHVGRTRVAFMIADEHDLPAPPARRHRRRRSSSPRGLTLQLGRRPDHRRHRRRRRRATDSRRRRPCRREGWGSATPSDITSPVQLYDQ